MFEIGNWVRRAGDSEAKWHRVESLIVGAAITRCGRRMRPSQDRGPGNELEVSGVEPLTRMIGQPQLCKRCASLPDVRIEPA